LDVPIPKPAAEIAPLAKDVRVNKKKQNSKKAVSAKETAFSYCLSKK